MNQYDLSLSNLIGKLSINLLGYLLLTNGNKLN